MPLGLDSLSGLINWAFTLSNKFDKETPEFIKERMPGFLGLSLEDEALFAEIRAELEIKEDEFLTDFLMACKDYERNRFRNVVASMPNKKIDKSKDEKSSIQKKKTDKGGNKKTTSKETSNAVKFLKRIAKLVEREGHDEAYRLCLSGGVIIKDPLHQKALKKWRESVTWFKKKILDTLGVQSLSEIDLKIANRKLNELAVEMEVKVVDPILKPIEEYIKKEKKKKFLVRMFTFF